MLSALSLVTVLPGDRRCRHNNVRVASPDFDALVKWRHEMTCLFGESMKSSRGPPLDEGDARDAGDKRRDVVCEGEGRRSRRNDEVIVGG